MKDDSSNVSENVLDRIHDVIPAFLGFWQKGFHRVSTSKLKYTQFRVISILHKQSNTNNRQLAERIGLSFPAMSRMVDGLVRRGFVRRVASSRDRREVHLELTAKGRREFQIVRGALKNTLRARVEKIAPHDRTTLTSGLNLLKELLT